MAGFVNLVHGYELPLLIVLLVLAVVLGVYLYRRLNHAAPDPAHDPFPLPPQAGDTDDLAGQTELSPALMRTAFRNGWRIYQDSVAGLRNPYLVPWVLAVAAEGGGLTTLCAAGEAAHPPAETIDPATRRPVGVTWWFHDQAVVLEVASDAFVRRDGARVADAAWTALLEDLSSRRSALPLDGIVLAISATDLGGPDAPPRQQLAEKAMRIYSRLWQAQRALGISLPVWVVVTRCDIIPGFQALAEALPEARRGQALGWSSPYALDSAFQPDWISKAFDTIQDHLVAAGLELAAMAAGAPRTRATLELPRELDLLREPISIVLSNVFRRTPFQESLFFRGIWLTGAAGLSLPADVIALDGHGGNPASGGTRMMAPSRQTLPLAFARDLFVHKVFAERDLPRPAPRWASGTARTEVAWRIGTGAAAVLAAVLLWTGTRQLIDLRATYVPALKALEEPMRSSRQAERDPARAASGVMFGAPQAIRAITRIDADWAEPWFPASWFDSLKERVSVALSVAHYQLMMADIRTHLEQRATAIASLTHDQTGGPGYGDLPRIRRLVGEALLLESYVQVFNRLQVTGGTDGLAELLRFTHGIHLPATYVALAEELDFTRVPSNRQLRQATLGNGASPLDYAELRPPLEARLRELSVMYFRRLTKSGNVSSDLALLAARIAELTHPDSARTALPPLLPAIADGLARISEQLASGDGLWPGLTEAGLGPPAYRELLGLVTNSPLLGPTVRDGMVSDAYAILGDSDASGLSLSPIGPLVTPAGSRNRLDLSPLALALQTSLNSLNARTFMHAATGLTALPDLAPGLVRWDTRPLELAVAMTGEHALFLARDLPAMPEPLRPGIRAIARDQLLSSVFDAVARAQLGSPANGGARTPELKAMAASTAAAAPLFRRLADALRQAEQPASADRLMDALTRQSIAVLDRATALIDTNPVYQPPDVNLSEWAGSGMDTPRLFGQIDLAAVTAMLDQQRQEIASLLRDVAAPVMAVLGTEGMPSTAGKHSVRVWSEIAADLDESGQKRPGGSLAALEKFIAIDLPMLKPGDCPMPRASSLAGNWFAGQLSRLRDRLSRQCQLVSGTLAMAAYQQIEQSFEAYLAGRYPFAAPGEDSGGQYASAWDLVAFYRIFDAQAAGLAETMAAMTPAQTEPARFIETMRQLRPFLAAVAGLSGGDAAVKLEPRFRALPTQEYGAEEVIEASLQVAGVGSDDIKSRPLLWHIGDPIKVAFRWALNAPHLPVTITGAPHAATRGGLTTATYDDRWSLVTLLRTQRPSLAEWSPAPGQPRQMLAFQVPTTLADGKPSHDPASRLFVELTVRPAARPEVPAAPGSQAAADASNEPFSLPDFPAHAPAVYWGVDPGRLRPAPRPVTGEPRPDPAIRRGVVPAPTAVVTQSTLIQTTVTQPAVTQPIGPKANVRDLPDGKPAADAGSGVRSTGSR